MPEQHAQRDPTRQLLAWCVHLFTASGAVLGVFALWEIGRGGFSRAAIYMLAALSIDAVDGTLARRVGTARHAPAVDGRRLDDIADYLNFVAVPVVFLMAAGAFVHWSAAALPVLASAYGFSQVHAKTDDDFFLGWPSYWNVVALYVWLLGITPAAATAWVALFSALVFVPLKYVYPSRLRRWRAAAVAGGTLWVWAMAFAVWFPEAATRAHVVEISLAYPAFYLFLSAWLGDWRHAWRPA